MSIKLQPKLSANNLSERESPTIIDESEETLHVIDKLLIIPIEGFLQEQTYFKKESSPSKPWCG